MTSSRRPHGQDEGFTLIEVVVAVVLMAVVFASVSVFFVAGIGSATGLQRRDSAVQVADQAMQLVRGVPATTTSPAVSKLVRNRAEAAVTAQWLDRPDELAQTTPVWDDAPAGVPAIPLTATSTVTGQEYVVDTFIGTCTQPADDSACTNAAGTVGELAYRIVVRVSWTEGDGTSCAGEECEYLLTTLVNGDGDLIFNTSLDAPRPVAGDDTATTAVRTDVAIDVLANDSGGLRPSPINIVTNPVNGSFVGNTSNGPIVYRPNPNFFGTDTFTYRISNTSDLTSDPATVTITVPAPVITARTDTLTVVQGRTAAVAVAANDTGFFDSPPTITLLTPAPSRGTVVIQSDRSIAYTSTSSTGSDTIRYRITDQFGQSRDAQVAVTVTAPPAAVNDSRNVTAPNSITVDVRANDQAPLNTGTVSNLVFNPTIGSAVLSGNQVAYTPRVGFSGNAVITYTVTAGGGSATATLTVAVAKPPAPAARNFTVCVLRNGGNDVPIVVELSTGITSGITTGGTYLLPGGGPNAGAYNSTLNASTGRMQLTSNGSPPNSVQFTYRFRDAWGTQSAQRTVTLQGKDTC